MNATVWDTRSRKYDAAIREHDALYEKTFWSTKALLGDSDVVLDYGCATGEFSLDIASHVQRIQGIDTSAKMIELAKKKALGRQVRNVEFDQINSFDQRLMSNSFSAILAFSIFHLLDDPSKALVRLSNLLEPGGLLISQTPCLGERSLTFRCIVSLAQAVGIAPMIQSFRIAALESLVSGCGFEILETKIWDKRNAIQWIVARKICNS